MNEPSESSPTASYVPRYASLPDYLHVLRRYWLTIALFAVLGVALAVGWAATKSKVYEASATLSFRDIAQDASLLGPEQVPELPPAVRAAVNAELVNRPEVTRRVARELDAKIPRGALTNAIDAQVGAQTQLVTLKASAGGPVLAAEIANEYARQARIVGTRETERRLARIEESLVRELQALKQNPAPGSGVRLSVLESQLSRVNTLRDITSPVQIVESATPPGSPASPQPMRDGILGGLVGLVLGLIAAFGRDALDRRMRTAREIHTELGLPVLGRIRESALGSPGLAKNGSMPMSDSDFESFRVLRTRLGYLADERPLSSILVTSGQPNEGKSTVAMSLASAAALAGQRVLLVEGDLRRPIFARRMGVMAVPGLCDYLRAEAEPEDIVQTVELTSPRGSSSSAPENGAPGARRGSPGLLACVTAGTQMQDAAELLASGRFEKLVDETREVYDLVVIDSGPLLAVVDPLELVRHVDAMIVCVRAREATRDEARSVRSVLANLPELPACAVVTGLRSDGPDAYRDYYG